MKDIKHEDFIWQNLGNIKEGRYELGEEMPVFVYRLMQYTLLNVLSKANGLERANSYFRKAGHLAGTEFAKNTLDLTVDFNAFIAGLEKTLHDLKIGVMRMEFYNPDTGSITLTIAQDLNCSGLPNTSETKCVYDEGFIAGILEVYTGKRYDVREIDCWANGDKVCRFSGNIIT